VDIGYTGTGMPTYTGNTIVFATQLLQTKAYNFEMRIVDKFGVTVMVPKTVPVGQPMLFLDSVKKSVGINMFPTGTNAFEINTGVDATNGGVQFKGTNVSGKIWTGTGGVVLQSNGTANLHLGQNNTTDLVFYADRIQFGSARAVHFGTSMFATGTPAVDLNNSDIIGANSIYFDDTATSSAEAIQFMRSNTPAGSFSATDWDSFRVYDGTGYLNDKPIFTSDSDLLWNGNVAYVSSAQTITPTKKLSSCPHGWVLVWCDYDGSGTTGNNYDYVFTLIPKHFPQLNSGALCMLSIPNFSNTTSATHTIKKVYVTDTNFSGHDDNSASGTSANDVVLKYVFQI
jgi:hypothetical protein